MNIAPQPISAAPHRRIVIPFELAASTPRTQTMSPPIYRELGRQANALPIRRLPVRVAVCVRRNSSRQWVASCHFTELLENPSIEAMRNRIFDRSCSANLYGHFNSKGEPGRGAERVAYHLRKLEEKQPHSTVRKWRCPSKLS
jgi:hypothetical protein